MAAFLYLAFVVGLAVLALYGATMAEVYTPMNEATQGVAESPEASTGAMWLQDFFGMLPLVVLGLLVFAFIVGLVLRRNRVGGGI